MSLVPVKSTKGPSLCFSFIVRVPSIINSESAGNSPSNNFALTTSIGWIELAISNSLTPNFGAIAAANCVSPPQPIQ